MNPLPSSISSIFRPEDESLSAETKREVQTHRLIALFGTVLTAFFGLLQKSAGPNTIPTWPSFLIGGLFVGLLGASYLSTRARRGAARGIQGLLYVLIGWFSSATALAGFPESYAAVLLFAYAVLPPLVGFGTGSIRPALWLGGFGLAAAASSVALMPAPAGRPLLLLGCMVGTGLVEGIAAQQLALSQNVRRATNPFERGEPFPSVAENVPVALFRTVPGEGIVYANRAFADIFGYDHIEEVLEVSPDALYTSSRMREQLWARARREGHFDDVEVRLKRKDGSIFTGLFSGTVVYGEDGTVNCYDGAVADISERSGQEQILRSELASLERLFESLPTPIARGRLDQNGNVRVQSANEAFKETFGMEGSREKEAPQEPLAPTIDEGSRTSAFSYRSMGGGPQVEIQRNTTEGSQVFQLHLAGRKQTDGPPEVYLLYTDITPQKRQMEKIQEAQREAISRLAETAERADYETSDHIRRVGKMARLLAEALGQPSEWQARIEEAAPFHDIGKICVADHILRKSGPLSGEEQEEMERHASIGPALLSGGESELIQMARRVARSHHERWDGEGYPDGLEGEEIPLSARIVAVADAFDAMTHDRPYREARSVEQAFAVIEEEAGAQFDPQVSRAALQRREEMAALI